MTAKAGRYVWPPWPSGSSGISGWGLREGASGRARSLRPGICLTAPHGTGLNGGAALPLVYGDMLRVALICVSPMFGANSEALTVACLYPSHILAVARARPGKSRTSSHKLARLCQVLLQTARSFVLYQPPGVQWKQYQTHAVLCSVLPLPGPRCDHTEPDPD
jgi:hypothetical protein